MNDTSANNAGSIEAGVTKAGEALGELVQSATAATAAAVGHAQKTVQDATAVTAVAAGQARRMLGDASEAARQARGQAGAVAEHVVDTGVSGDQIRFAADPWKAVDGGSGRLRARLRRRFMDWPRGRQARNNA